MHRDVSDFVVEDLEIRRWLEQVLWAGSKVIIRGQHIHAWNTLSLRYIPKDQGVLLCMVVSDTTSGFSDARATSSFLVEIYQRRNACRVFDRRRCASEVAFLRLASGQSPIC